MQNDGTTSFPLPSYRERIVQVRLEKTEGGLNLDMPAETLARIAEKGTEAGRVLVDDSFWPNRWTRFQVVMGQLEAELREIAARMNGTPAQFDVDWLLQEQKSAGFPYRKNNAAWKANVRAVLAALEKLVRDWPLPPKPEDREQARHQTNCSTGGALSQVPICDCRRSCISRSPMGRASPWYAPFSSRSKRLRGDPWTRRSWKTDNTEHLNQLFGDFATFVKGLVIIRGLRILLIMPVPCCTKSIAKRPCLCYTGLVVLPVPFCTNKNPYRQVSRTS